MLLLLLLLLRYSFLPLHIKSLLPCKRCKSPGLTRTKGPSSSAMSSSFSVPIAFAPSATLSRTLVNPERPKAPLERLSKSRTTVRSFPVLFSRYTDNSALLIVCHSVNKLSAIFWGANSSGFMERSTCVERARLLAGGECDRLVLLFSLHQKTKPFSPRSSLIVAVMLPSSPVVRFCPSLQRITTIFFSVNQKKKRKLVYFIYPWKFFYTKPCEAPQITKTKNSN